MDTGSTKQIFHEHSALLKRLALLFVVLIIFDQATKYIAQAELEGLPEIILIPGTLGLYFFKNHIDHVYQYIVYIVLNLVVMPPLLIYLINKGTGRIVLTGMVLLWSAIFSNNIIDVFSFGYIRDFINLHGVAVGNVADQYRTLGGILIIAGLVLGDGKKLSRKTAVIASIMIILFLILLMLFWKYLSRFMAI